MISRSDLLTQYTNKFEKWLKNSLIICSSNLGDERPGYTKGFQKDPILAGAPVPNSCSVSITG